MKNNIILPIAAVSILLALPSCSNLRDTLGLERSSPNEYAVEPSQVDLEMPPDFYILPTPEPGAKRPQETTQNSKAKSILLGSAGHTHDHAGAESSGTAAFLEEAGVESGHDAIRGELYQEAEVEKRKGGTIAQQLGLKRRDPGEVLKPVEEQERLQKTGIETSKYVEEMVDED